MEPVADTLHLQKRGDVWHYYRRVPQHLVPIIGRRFIKRSLGVTKREDAKRLRTIEDLKVEAMFAAAEKGSLSSDRKSMNSSGIACHAHRTCSPNDNAAG
jgi:hypothetical protein